MNINIPEAMLRRPILPENNVMVIKRERVKAPCFVQEDLPFTVLIE
jgi:hypothetical protein